MDELEWDDATVECPHCGAEIYDDVDQCPSCRTYLSPADFRRPMPSWLVWIWILVVIGLLLPFVRWLI